jgi:hypothetical protein
MAGVTRRAAGTLAILRAWPGQRRQPHQPFERQLALRDRRIRETVLHAARHVPFYRSLGLQAGDLRTA